MRNRVMTSYASKDDLFRLRFPFRPVEIVATAIQSRLHGWKNPTIVGSPSNIHCDFMLSRLKRLPRQGSNRNPLKQNIT